MKKKPITGLKRRIRRLFKEWKLSLRPVIFGPEGRFDEPGDEDDDDAAEVASAAPRAAASPEIEKLRGYLERSRPRLDQVAAQDTTRKAEIDRNLAAFEATAAAGDAAGARQALNALAELVKALAGTGGDSAGQNEALNSAFGEARLEWNQTRLNVHRQIRDFQNALRDELREEADFSDVDREIAKLDLILTTLDEGLEVRLDEAMKAQQAADKTRLKEDAQRIVRDYIGFVRENPYLPRLDLNQFMPMTVNAELTARLAALEKSLA